MPISANDLIAGRYRLLERLGAGGMGEVWKARDEKFQVRRSVAIKLIKEEESLRDDQRAREWLKRLITEEADALTPELVISAIDGAFGNHGDAALLRQRVQQALGVGRELSIDFVLSVFDTLVNDPDCNANARDRYKLRQAFLTEANSVAGLSHPNIVNTFDTGEHDGVPYLVMDFVDGRTLRRMLQRGEQPSRVRQLRLMEDLCEGLHHAHEHHLIHRDIKPDNVIVDAVTQRLKILDFGVVKSLKRMGDLASTVFGGGVGTLPYMSPEQARQVKIDRRSDIFAVGSVFYELLTGRKAFPPRDGESPVHFLVRLQTEPPIPLESGCPGLQPEIVRIVNRALEKEPDRRYQDLDRMRRDIERVRVRLELETGSDAETEIEPIVPAHPTLERARAALAAGDFAAAIVLANEVLRDVPDLTAAVELLAKARAGRLQRQIDSWLEEARELLRRGDLVGAEARVVQVLREQPDSKPAADLRRAIDDVRREQQEASEARANEVLKRAEMEVSGGRLDRAVAILGALVPPHPRVSTRLDQLRRALALRLSARETFQRGQRAEALGLLEAFDYPALVADELKLLRAAQAALVAAERAVREGPRAARDAALAEMERWVPAEFVAGALAQLRQLAAARDANEERAARDTTQQALRLFGEGRRAEAIELLARFEPATLVAAQLRDCKRAETAIVQATAAVANGGRRQRDAALAYLAEFTPAALVASSLTTLRREAAEKDVGDDGSAARARATEAMAQARASFIAGHRADAIDRLLRFEPRPLVEPLLVQLNNAEAAIASARGAVANGTRADRDIALASLARFKPADLVASSLAGLRDQAEARTRADGRTEEDVANEAIGAARAEFAAGRRVEALNRLSRFEPPHLVETALFHLGRANEAITQATTAFSRGDSAQRAAAITALSRFTPGDLVADALASLRRQTDRPDGDGAERDLRQREAEVARLIANGEAHLGALHADDALAAALKALELLPDSAAANALLQRAEAAVADQRQRQRHYQAVVATVREAKRDFDAGHTEKALRLLQDFKPPHVEINQALGMLRAELRRRANQSLRARLARALAQAQAPFGAAAAWIWSVGRGPIILAGLVAVFVLWGVFAARRSLLEDLSTNPSGQAATTAAAPRFQGIGAIVTLVDEGNLPEAARRIDAAARDHPNDVTLRNWGPRLLLQATDRMTAAKNQAIKAGAAKRPRFAEAQRKEAEARRAPASPVVAPAVSAFTVAEALYLMAAASDDPQAGAPNDIRVPAPRGGDASPPR